MYRRSEKPQAMYTQKLIVQAFISLLETNEFEQITITQICEKATVSRRTYYRSFDSKADIIDCGFDLSSEKCLQKPFIEIENYSELFYLLDQCKSILSRLYKAKQLSILIDKIFELIIKRMEDSGRYFIMQDYSFAFIRATIDSVISTWVENGFKENYREIVRLVQGFLSGLTRDSQY